ncbi:YggS family pyridoxal phosphate-dependent enzyme [Leptobacterium flavescens]|uniref:Pyridoxal phosphate homeostasis protein n=1 Tax=Leptobacterium flavescens TaxID=472055 RepID=A0A6P0UR46_9FLAO|nr:YggS family pyridoxal phosphate-dependent enzyme [Leptobacterium flavescens]NER13323.1 YggS family pyridoxal phosphate-dependent enzyme [Leptobacterium flavescens]
MSISQNLQKLKLSIPQDVELVAVSKTKPVSDIQEAYDSGHRVFGENKIQEMAEKYEQLPEDIKWHMIGHVQTNKVKYMASFVSLIHGVDSLKLLREVNKQALKHDRVIDCLLQIRIAEEETKFGMSEDDAVSLLNSDVFNELTNVRIKGFMGMATFTHDKGQVEKEFKSLKSFFDRCKNETGNHSSVRLEILSMGMSGDYDLAISNGSNMVRIGSSIFGERNYSNF